MFDNHSNICVSRKTIHQRLLQDGLQSYIEKKKPYIYPQNKMKQLEFVQKCTDKPMSFWKLKEYRAAIDQEYLKKLLQSILNNSLL